MYSANGEITTSALQKLESEKTNLRVFQEGGISHPKDLRELLSYAFRFRGQVTGANSSRAAPIAFITKPYSVVPTEAGQQVPSLAHQRRKLTELAEWHGAAKTRRRDLINAEAASGECPGRKKKFSRAITGVENVMAKIESEAQACVDAPAGGCGQGNARPLPRDAYLKVIEECASDHARREELAARAKSDAEKRRLEAQLKEERKGEQDGSPCKTWEIRSVRPGWGSQTEWVSLTATASAGGSMQAKQVRALNESTGWAVAPALSVPTGAVLQIEGKESYSVSCGFLNLGSCRKTRVVATRALKLAQHIKDGTSTDKGFTVRAQCVESTRGKRGKRARSRPGRGNPRRRLQPTQPPRRN